MGENEPGRSGEIHEGVWDMQIILLVVGFLLGVLCTLVVVMTVMGTGVGL